VHRGAEANSNGAHKHMGFSKLQLRMNYVIQSSAPLIRSPARHVQHSVRAPPHLRAASPASINLSFPLSSLPGSSCLGELHLRSSPPQGSCPPRGSCPHGKVQQAQWGESLTTSAYCHSLDGPRAFCHPPLELGSGLVDGRDEVPHFPSRQLSTLHSVRFLGYG
jgi:hypothetical protein